MSCCRRECTLTCWLDRKRSRDSEAMRARCLYGGIESPLGHANAGVLVLGTFHVKSKTQERVWVGSGGDMLFLL